ncbi:MAG: hypothetical protein KME29_22340 [Calothrix sp. FI2-JRJ7]|jgi:hypothetical protein|nr:hypothetical protein [Calothrix sp. FI2-JRJ7]
MSIKSLTKVALPLVFAASALSSASVFANVKSSSQTQNLIASAPQRQLIATVRSQGEPQRGQKSRSSGNFSTDNMPQGYSSLCWQVSETSAVNPSQIKFNVMEDLRVLKDKTIFKNVQASEKSAVKKARNLYIANPSGAYDKFGNTVGFAVNIYACN